MAFVLRRSLFGNTACSARFVLASGRHKSARQLAYLRNHLLLPGLGCTSVNSNNLPGCRYGSTDAAHPLSKRVTDTAEVVVIGGGAIGTSVAYHLAKAGMKNVVLLEKTELTAGSTWHATGLTTYFQHSLCNRRLNAITINLFKDLEKETGQEVGFHNPGTLRLITSPIRFDEARYEQSLSSWMPHSSKLISAEEVEKLHPFLNMDKITGALYTKEDGHVDPYSLTQAYAAGARLHGAEIFLKSPVLSLKQRSDGGWDVQTEHGTINAKRVVNSAGVWARDVYQMVGLDMPVTITQHQYAVTTTIPEIEDLGREVPVIRDLDGSYYVRQERKGLLIGPYESADTMKVQEQWFDSGVPQGFGRELFENDVDRISPHLERAMEMCPLIERADIQTVVNGPMPHTADFAGLLGPYLGLENFWCCSSQIGGIIHSGGAGHTIAYWIIHGEPPFDVFATDPNRFDKWMTRDHAIDMSRESYGSYNNVVYPKFSTEAFVLGRPTQRVSGIYEKLKRNGAQYGFVAGWEVPVWFAKGYDVHGFKPYFRRANWFEQVHRECEFVVNDVGIIDLSARGKFEVTGSDAQIFLDELVAGDLPEVGLTSVAYMLSLQGRVLSELSISKLADDHFFVVNEARSELHDLRWMLQQLKAMRYNVDIKNVTDDIACLGVAGPDTRTFLSAVTSTDLQDQHFPYGAIKDIQVAGVPVRAIRTSYTGELGWELYHAKADTLRLYDAIKHIETPDGVIDFGWYALDVLRLERGIPAMHSEFSMEYNALEADLGSLINLEKKTSFIGKEGLSHLHKGEITKKRAYIVIHSRPGVDPHGVETIWKDGKTVGYMTSGCYSYRINKGIGFAYVSPELAEPGTRLDVEIQGKLAPAVVTYPAASEEYIDI
ncbi:dimethylglycine dehydrogenase, mitochondrial-like [Amphiura filiformis]|uniref:dimethylglycine dehydrogenase, mitochondrial-like n=1 Tax=Amphiura filiformis TaxID=82378 RepID=UPI003B21FCB3